MKRILYITSIIAFFAALAIVYSSETSFASCGKCSTGGATKAASSQAPAAEEAETVTDTVCGMEVKKNPEKSFKHKDYTYYFCSKGCIEKFKKDTKKYACPCIDIHTGCNCYHCTGRGGGCDCPKGPKKGGEGHKHRGGEGHRH